MKGGKEEQSQQIICIVNNLSLKLMSLSSAFSKDDKDIFDFLVVCFIYISESCLPFLFIKNKHRILWAKSSFANKKL